jgi:hypothetical protein
MHLSEILPMRNRLKMIRINAPPNSAHVVTMLRPQSLAMLALKDNSVQRGVLETDCVAAGIHLPLPKPAPTAIHADGFAKFIDKYVPVAGFIRSAQLGLRFTA